MHHLEFALNDPVETFYVFRDQLDTIHKTSEYFELSPNIGNGFGLNICLEEGLYLTILNLQFFEEFTALRHPSTNNQYYQVVYWSSNSSSEFSVENKLHPIGKNTLAGIIFGSPKMNGFLRVEKNSFSLNVNLTFSRKWLKDNQLKIIEEKILDENNFWIHDDLNIESEMLLNQVIALNPKTAPRIRLKAISYLLLASFIDKISKRALLSISGLKNDDVEKIYISKAIIENNIEQSPSIKELAQKVGLSEAGFQKKFQHIFGITVYKYIQKRKMELAKALLEARKLSISEIGYQVGYSNLSHFSRVFKETFGLTPSSFLAQL